MLVPPPEIGVFRSTKTVSRATRRDSLMFREIRSGYVSQPDYERNLTYLKDQEGTILSGEGYLPAYPPPLNISIFL